jgi:hypothetical protein
MCPLPFHRFRKPRGYGVRSIVLPVGFEPTFCANLARPVYKSGGLPLTYRSEMVSAFRSHDLRPLQGERSADISAVKWTRTTTGCALNALPLPLGYDDEAASVSRAYCPLPAWVLFQERFATRIPVRFLLPQDRSLVETTGIEPATSCSRSRRTTRLCYVSISYTRVDSNHH